MTTLASAATLPSTTAANTPLNRSARQRETWALLALLLLFNLGLLLGHGPARALMYDPAAVAGGAWWRIATWPWVHVSRYHLLLDGAAFLLLYHGLQAPSRSLRVGYLLAVSAGSLLLPVVATPQLARYGLCGLSGPAHGLLAISLLELATRSTSRALGRWLLAGLLAKTAWELCSGSVFLHQWHIGDIGIPIVTTHAGGLLGGLLAFTLAQHRPALTCQRGRRCRAE